MPDGKAYADGGLWAIDPGVVALAEAANIIDHDTACRGHVERLDEVQMLSIGTGQAEYTLAPPGGDAGSLFWARHVAEVMSISQVQGTQLPLQMVLGDRYHIVDFPLEDPNWTLDNLEVTDQLFQLGRERGKELFGELEEVFLSRTVGAVLWGEGLGKKNWPRMNTDLHRGTLGTMPIDPQHRLEGELAQQRYGGLRKPVLLANAEVDKL